MILPWNRTIHEFIAVQLVMELSTFVRHEGSLLCSQEPTSEPYPDPAESNPKSLETK